MSAHYHPVRHPELELHDVPAGALRHGLGQPGLHGILPRADDAPAAAPGGQRWRSALIAHFDPLMWVIENPATCGRAAEDPAVHGAPALGGRDLLQVRNSVQEADAAVDQHALEAEARPAQARQPLRRVAGRQARPGRAAGAAAMEGQYERDSQSRELLYSVPAALCEKIARAATEELAAEHSGLSGLPLGLWVKHACQTRQIGLSRFTCNIGQTLLDTSDWFVTRLIDLLPPIPDDPSQHHYKPAIRVSEGLSSSPGLKPLETGH